MASGLRTATSPKPKAKVMLQTSNNKIVKIETFPALQICAKDLQIQAVHPNEVAVTQHFYNEDQDQTNIAFAFWKNNKYYYPFVEGEQLKLDEKEGLQTPIDSKYKFKWNCEKIESVAKPDWFLTMEEGGTVKIDTRSDSVFKQSVISES